MKMYSSVTTSSSLIRRIRDLEDQEGWREFACCYRDLIRRLALSASLTHDEAEEVWQEVLISVARNIGKFEYERRICSFKRWLSNLTRWRISGQLRKRRMGRFLVIDLTEALSDPDLTGQLVAPAEEPVESREQAEAGWKLLETALASIKNRVNPTHYQIYFLHVLKDLSVEEVCRRLLVNRGQVYLAKLRVGRLMEKKIRALAREL